ncbi:MAG: TonB family protein [Sphingobacteriaceae bacterium]
MDTENDKLLEPEIKPDRSVLYFALAMFIIVLVMAILSTYQENIRKIVKPTSRTAVIIEKKESPKHLNKTRDMDDVEIKASLTKFIEAFYVDQKKGYFDPPSYFSPITETYFNYHNLTFKGLKQVHDARLADLKNLELTWLVHTLEFERKDDSLSVNFWTRQRYFKPSKSAQESAEIKVEMVLDKEGKIKSLKETEVKNLESVVIKTTTPTEPVKAAKTPPTVETKPKEPAELTVFNSGLLDTPPEFKGGNKKWLKYLNRNLKYPARAQEQHVQGRVFVSFIIEPNGSLSNFKLIRGIGSGCDEEAMRVLKNSPDWKPGILDGKPVRTSYVLPVIFQLAD